MSGGLPREKVRFDGRVRKRLKDEIVQWRFQERLTAVQKVEISAP